MVVIKQEMIVNTLKMTKKDKNQKMKRTKKTIRRTSQILKKNKKTTVDI
jgi:hypothetical protein